MNHLTAKTVALTRNQVILSLFLAENELHDHDKGDSANTHHQENFGRYKLCTVHRFAKVNDFQSLIRI